MPGSIPIWPERYSVLPTRMPLEEFYAELVSTQRVMNMKHMGWTALKATAGIAAKLLARGQTNFVKMLWKFNSVYNEKLLLADHQLPTRYEMTPPPPVNAAIDARSLYVHAPQGRRGRAIDDATEHFVEETRMGESS